MSAFFFSTLAEWMTGIWTNKSNIKTVKMFSLTCHTIDFCLEYFYDRYLNKVWGQIFFILLLLLNISKSSQLFSPHFIFDNISIPEISVVLSNLELMRFFSKVKCKHLNCIARSLYCIRPVIGHFLINYVDPSASPSPGW